jgi:hypothetical protein
MMNKSKIKEPLPEPQPNGAETAGELPSAQVLPNPMLAVVFSPDESEFRTQKHLMDAEGTTDTEPSKEAVFNYVKSRGYYADAIDVWYDTMQHIWRWSCNIIYMRFNWHGDADEANKIFGENYGVDWSFSNNA